MYHWMKNLILCWMIYKSWEIILNTHTELIDVNSATVDIRKLKKKIFFACYTGFVTFKIHSLKRCHTLTMNVFVEQFLFVKNFLLLDMVHICTHVHEFWVLNPKPTNLNSQFCYSYHLDWNLFCKRNRMIKAQTKQT